MFDAIEKILAERVVTEYGAAVLPDEPVPLPGMRYAVSFLLPLPRAAVSNVKNL